MPVTECKAADPTTCPYHGVPSRLREAVKNEDASAYIKARSESKPKVTPPTDPSVLTVKEYKLLWKRLRGGYELSVLKKMDIGVDTPANVSYNRNGEAAFNYENYENQELFSKGACGFFAYAVHEKTGLPLVVFTEDPKSDYWQGHVAVKISEGKFLDITGISDERTYESRYGLEPGVYSMETVESQDRFKELMGLPSAGTVYDKLGDLEKAILDRNATDVVRDFL